MEVGGNVAETTTGRRRSPFHRRAALASDGTTTHRLTTEFIVGAGVAAPPPPPLCLGCRGPRCWGPARHAVVVIPPRPARNVFGAEPAAIDRADHAGKLFTLAYKEAAAAITAAINWKYTGGSVSLRAHDTTGAVLVATSTNRLRAPRGGSGRHLRPLRVSSGHQPRGAVTQGRDGQEKVAVYCL